MYTHMRFMALLLFASVLILGVVFTASCRAADGHGHPEADQKLHEQFYKSWQRLDIGSSCCNNDDCFPTIMLQGENGHWYAMKKSGLDRIRKLIEESDTAIQPPLPPLEDTTYWVDAHPKVLEHNARVPGLGIAYPRDPRDSPDGRSHACISGDYVLCAVVGVPQ